MNCDLCSATEEYHHGIFIFIDFGSGTYYKFEFCDYKCALKFFIIRFDEGNYSRFQVNIILLEQTGEKTFKKSSFNGERDLYNFLLEMKE